MLEKGVYDKQCVNIMNKNWWNDMEKWLKNKTAIFEKVISESYSFSEVARKLWMSENGISAKYIKTKIKKENLDISHFDPYKNSKMRKKVQVVNTHCTHPECGIEHGGKYGSGRFCSSKCAKGYSTYLKREEINNKVSDTLKIKNKKDDKECKECKKLFAPSARRKTFCSRNCARINNIPKFIEAGKNSIAISIASGTHKGWAPRTGLSFAEKYYKDQLDKSGYKEKYIINHPISQMDLGMDKPYCYYIDFYFPELRLCLEIDGKQHLHEDRMESDKIRDSFLAKAGYEMYRIPWMGIKTQPDLIKTEENVKTLLSFLENKNTKPAE